MTSREFAVRSKVALLPPAAKRALRAGIDSALTMTVATVSRSPLSDFSQAISRFDPAELWFATAAVRGELPTSADLRRTRRLLELDGPWAAIERIVAHRPTTAHPLAVTEPNAVVLDVTGLLPGSEMHDGLGVGRQLVRNWAENPDVIPVTWHGQATSLRALTGEEANALRVPAPRYDSAAVILPWQARYCLVGTVDKPRSGERLIALGRESNNITSSIGYGLNPLVSVEAYVRQEGEERFSWHVAAQRSFDNLVVVGDSVFEHYVGLEQMLPAIGVTGPTLHNVSLPNSAKGSTGVTIATEGWKRMSHTVGSFIGIQ
jgi:hypothetical protein